MCYCLLVPVDRTSEGDTRTNFSWRACIYCKAAIAASSQIKFCVVLAIIDSLESSAVNDDLHGESDVRASSPLGLL